MIVKRGGEMPMTGNELREPISARDAIEAQYALREALFTEAKATACSVCGRGMAVVRRLVEGAYQDVIACPLNSSHQGHRKRRSITQMVRDGDAIDPFVSARIKRRMEEEMEEQGATTQESQALTIYGERYPITQAAASRIIELFYPQADFAARAEATILATQYNLNPLPSRREMYIIGFKDEWAVVLGIAAHRILARRRAGSWSYVEVDCPTSPFRPMTKAEIEAIGEDYDGKVWATVTLEVTGGQRYSGMGNFSKQGKIIGEDKGNTRWDMACKRAEAKALARIVPPEELPAPMSLTIEGVYADVTEIIESPKIEAPSRSPKKEPVLKPISMDEITHVCGIHKVDFKRYSKPDGEVWYSHKLPDGKWCNEGQAEAGKKPEEPTTERHQPSTQARPALAAIPTGETPALAPKSAPGASQDAPKKNLGPVIEEDFLAMSDIDQANLLIETVREFGRDKWAKMRQEIGLPAKTAIELTAKQRLTALKAIVGAKSAGKPEEAHLL